MDTETQIMDSQIQITQIMDTETQFMDSPGLQYMDTETQIMDTETQIMDSQIQITQIMDTEIQFMDSPGLQIFDTFDLKENDTEKKEERIKKIIMISMIKEILQDEFDKIKNKQETNIDEDPLPQFLQRSFLKKRYKDFLEKGMNDIEKLKKSSRDELDKLLISLNIDQKYRKIFFLEWEILKVKIKKRSTITLIIFLKQFPDIWEFLKNNGCGIFMSEFISNGYLDLNSLKSIQREKLKEMGIDDKHCRIINNEIKRMNGEIVEKDKKTKLDFKKYLDSLDL
eukprot:TRINITY_DN2004_c0_g1_i4.p1 TRINITY_DN2004_c0_g1~~TRINITY_DN2004_c0_g1_i4.p1  ORF type:complete len:313 (-),score=47.72 TRINITY_DN2004_c0_g1_i4:66-914(-)